METATSTAPMIDDDVEKLVDKMALDVKLAVRSNCALLATKIAATATKN